MSQTRLGSFNEAIVNVTTGYVVSVLSQIIILPLFSLNISLEQNLLIGLCFTLIGLVRVYLIRRWFEVIISKRRASNEDWDGGQTYSDGG